MSCEVAAALAQHGPGSLRAALTRLQRLIHSIPCSCYTTQREAATYAGLGGREQESHAERQASNHAASTSKASFHSRSEGSRAHHVALKQQLPVICRPTIQGTYAPSHVAFVRAYQPQPEEEELDEAEPGSIDRKLQRYQSDFPTLDRLLLLRSLGQQEQGWVSLLLQEEQQQQQQQREPAWHGLDAWQCLPPHLQTLSAAVLEALSLPEATHPLPADAMERLLKGFGRFQRFTHCSQQGWATPAASVQLTLALQHCTGLPPPLLATLLSKAPHLLRSQRLPDAQALEQQLNTLTSALSLAQNELQQLLLRRPKLLELAPCFLEDQLRYLGSGGLDLSPEEARTAVLRNPSLLLQPRRQWGTNVGFMVGLGLSSGQVKGLVLANPRWPTLKVRELILTWNFLRRECKAELQDLVLMPELLSCNLITTMGPRLTFARKNRFTVLLPSYCQVGTFLLAGPADWRRYKMVPLTYLLTAPIKQLCRDLQLGHREYELYKEAWQAAEGRKWERMVLEGGDAGQLLLMAEPTRKPTGASACWRLPRAVH